MTRMTELEDRLAAPDGEVLRTALLARLEQTALRLRGRLARPLPRDEYTACSTCLQATQAAQGVLRRWLVGTAREFPSPGSAVARRQGFNDLQQGEHP